MRTLDLAPLFRATVGFDNLSRIFDSVNRFDETQLSYPPYNIAKNGADAYRVSLAVAGFAESEIDIQVENNTLTVKGHASAEDTGVQYLHRGIAGRAFERRFELADHIRVVGARLENGLLNIDLKREIPEALKPRRVAITSTTAPQSTNSVIDAQVSAKAA